MQGFPSKNKYNAHSSSVGQVMFIVLIISWAYKNAFIGIQRTILKNRLRKIGL